MPRGVHLTSRRHGVLRLRGRFASRNGHSAQDDRLLGGQDIEMNCPTQAKTGLEWATRRPAPVPCKTGKERGTPAEARASRKSRRFETDGPSFRRAYGFRRKP